jgi:hypothetical protein
LARISGLSRVIGEGVGKRLGVARGFLGLAHLISKVAGLYNTFLSLKVSKCLCWPAFRRNLEGEQGKI